MSAAPPINIIIICTTSVIITAVIPPKNVYNPTTGAVVISDVQIDQPIKTLSNTALDQKRTPRSRAKNNIQVRDASGLPDQLELRPRYSGIVHIPHAQKEDIKIKAD